MENIRKQLIVKFVELNQLIDLFYIKDIHIRVKKVEIMGLLKDLNILTGKADSETIKNINAIEEFDKEQCKDFIDKNLKILFWDKELK